MESIKVSVFDRVVVFPDSCGVTASCSDGIVGCLGIVELVGKHSSFGGTYACYDFVVGNIGRRNGYPLDETVPHIHRYIALVPEPDVVFALGSPFGILVGGV